MTPSRIANPYRPGAGHPPPYLAGRAEEQAEFARLLEQEVVLENLVVTGLRGVGKSVLVDTFKPIAIAGGWLWAGSDLSEAASVSEEAMATRLLTDLAVATSALVIRETAERGVGFVAEARLKKVALTFDTMRAVFTATPGLVADKLKAVLELVATAIRGTKRGVVFAYDEAQNLADRADYDQYPLSMLLDVFQSLQRRGVPFLLLLTGLPTLFPKLVEARTYAERMFRVRFLRRLSDSDSRDAILKPLQARSPVRFDGPSVDLIVTTSRGYPFFIQYICRDAFDAFLSLDRPSVPIPEIMRKLDTDFFAGRWARATDRQRELLYVIASLPSSDDEFTVLEIVERSRDLLAKGFNSSHVNQMLAALSASGLVYKNRHGKYSFAVPLFGEFVLRQMTATD